MVGVIKKRSPKWNKLRASFLKGKSCSLCGGKKKLQAHHIKPFHIYPELELIKSNLIPLCEGSHQLNCHLFFGHLGNFKSVNARVIQDTKIWSKRIKERPKLFPIE